MLQGRISNLKYRSAAISLGSNVGFDRVSTAETLLNALKMLGGADAGDSVRLRAVSRFFTTPAFPAGSGPDFTNAAALVETTLSPAELMARLHMIEAHFGRTRTLRWGPRSLDLDLLAVNGLVLPSPEVQKTWMNLPPERQSQEAPAELILPHPRLQDRPFVLIPLAEIAPDWRHPILGRTVAEMANALSAADKAAIRPVAGVFATCQG